MITYFFIFLSTWNLQKEYDLVAKGYKAENKIGELKNSIVEAETSVRGYYITNAESFLKSYKESLDQIPVLYNELKALETKNPSQIKLLDSVQYLIEQRLSLMKKNIGLFEIAGKQNTEEINANHRRGQVIFDSIRLFSQRFVYAEDKLMTERKKNLSGSFNTTNIITIISLLTSIFAIFFSLYTYNKESQARDESAIKNIQYQHELEKHIEELKRMDDEVKELLLMK
jgi:CHASE3 domain sensor protein